MAIKSICQFRRIIVAASLVIVLSRSDVVRGGFGRREQRFSYYPVDTSYNQALNSIRCVDYDGHLSGKSRWPYSCLLPASHLATGRLFDGTSSVPERELAPEWLNLTLFEEGQKFARDNSGHLLLSHIYGLFCTNLFLDSKEVLLFFGGFDTPESASKRYVRIANGVFSWYRNSPSAKDFPTYEQVAKSIRTVRRAHRNVTLLAERQLFSQRQSLINPSVYKSRSVNEDLWKAFRMDVASSAVPYENRRFPIEYILTENERRPLNQFIQAMTLFGFVGFPVLFPERIGLSNTTDQQLHAYTHFWAVVAYCMGIRDEFNISLQPDILTTRKYFLDIFETFIEPAFFQVDFLTKVVLDPLLEGVNLLEATMTPGVVVTRILRDVLKMPAPNSEERLSSFEKLSLAVTDMVISNDLLVNRLLVSVVTENMLGKSKDST